MRTQILQKMWVMISPGEKEAKQRRLMLSQTANGINAVQENASRF
jgi:hypothetical protein